MNFKIERMNLNHVLLLQNVLDSDFDDFWSINTLITEIKNPNSYYIVATISSNIVGFAGVIQILDKMELNYIVTKKDKRNLGIASCLLDNLIQYANNKNIKSIELEVNEKNTSAIKLYEKFGFIKNGLRKKYYNNTDDAILMVKYT